MLNLNIMPDLRGMSLKDASYLLDKYHIDYIVNGSGIIKKQSIKIGRKSIFLKLNKFSLLKLKIPRTNKNRKFTWILNIQHKYINVIFR